MQKKMHSKTVFAEDLDAAAWKRVLCLCILAN